MRDRQGVALCAAENTGERGAGITGRNKTMWHVKDAADAWHISTRRVRKLCENDRVPGARQKIVKGKATWLMPEGATKPTDLRTKEAK